MPLPPPTRLPPPKSLHASGGCSTLCLAFETYKHCLIVKHLATPSAVGPKGKTPDDAYDTTVYGATMDDDGKAIKHEWNTQWRGDAPEPATVQISGLQPTARAAPEPAGAPFPTKAQDGTAEDLGDVMINQLTELFTKNSKNKTLH